jgi:spermidine/putrescine-binding protein
MKWKRSYYTLLLGLALVATACAQTPAAVETSAPVERVVKETVVVETTVEKIVTQEIEVVVTPTALPKPVLAEKIRVDSLSEGTGKNFENLVIKPFAEEMGIEIEVVNGTYASQDEWLASVKAAPGEHCIATYFSDFGLYNGVKQGLLQPFRPENMPNYANLDDRWETRTIVSGDPNAYVATIDIGMYTFVYAKDKIDEQPDSYAPLFDPKYAGRIALRDYGLYRIFQTASYLGINPNNMSEDDVNKVFDTMEQQASLTRAYWESSSQLDQLLANREVWMADYWFDTITRLGEDGTNKLGQLNIGWWFPKEGGPIWAGGPVIANGCEDLERTTAEMILNYMLRPDVFLSYTNSQGYIPTLQDDQYDKAGYFAATPYRAAYQQAIIDSGILLDVEKVLTNQEVWNERYEVMKLDQ